MIKKSFPFDLVSSDSIFKVILKSYLDIKKATHSNDVATKIVNAGLFSIFVSNAFNESVISGKFLSVLKLADNPVKPVHKKTSKLEKTNY